MPFASLRCRGQDIPSFWRNKSSISWLALNITLMQRSEVIDIVLILIYSAPHRCWWCPRRIAAGVLTFRDFDREGAGSEAYSGCTRVVGKLTKDVSGSISLWTTCKRNLIHSSELVPPSGNKCLTLQKRAAGTKKLWSFATLCTSLCCIPFDTRHFLFW